MASKTRNKLLSLLPPADKIALACGVDSSRAIKIQAQLGNLLEFVVDIIAEQAELIKGQEQTAKLVDKQTRQAQTDAQIKRDTLKFLSGDPIPVEHVLEMVFTPFWRGEFVKLEHEIKVEFFAALSKAIDSLEDKELEN